MTKTILPKKNPNKLLSVTEAGVLIGYSKTKMYELVRQNRIPHRRIGAYPGSNTGKIVIIESELMDWWHQQKKGGGE